MKKEVLLFGSNGGLGTGVAEVFKKAGFDRYYFFDPMLENGSQGNEVFVKSGDLSDAENTKKVFEIVEPSKEKILFLFSTVGGFVGGKNIEDTTPAEVSKMFTMNFTVNYNILAEFKKKVAECAGGSAVFTSAFVSFAGEAGKAAYGASKSALSHLVESGAEEGHAINLSVNAVAPYLIDTPANRSWLGDSVEVAMVKPKEIGELVVSLFNSYNFLSGNVLKIKHRFNELT
ncbi:MAG: SDR family NAD(P)-dependent oxidoreductase [Ignavibacteriales bacterium]|nr:MAG: SDR family NAD(P)-dependent oxidoreductase [Ignavibacteriaceae bacterium]MBW7872373.1 SDR family NAD(P)-dependent oxidoreductase [Ignavibacteria bacterium]MCZ2142656.1 SDR family NAD(P)-dependent oxidoreductase [Ignavibacteriales bacterium]OQY76065.1 MAG: hypothetical protein B6D45_04645 [Ignavibacteriales bacterium UTCHB3]MBV6445481.1 hypothetical protein [Ignavibacteriaceae bacterium]